ncbi:hypothetical protein BGZ73_000917, partial [Actinomortierella ambigua]
SLALAQDAIVSKAVFLGKDTTNECDTGAQVYEKIENYPTAAATLLVSEAEISRYERHSSQVVKSIIPYKVLETKLHEFEGLKFNETRTLVTLTSTSRGDLYKAVRDAYEGTERGVIAAVMRNLVPSKNHNDSLKTWLLSVPVIRRDSSSGRVIIQVARLILRLDTDEDGKVEIVAGQDAKFAVSEFELDPKHLQEHADQLAKKYPLAKVDHYKWYFTSKRQ